MKLLVLSVSIPRNIGTNVFWHLFMIMVIAGIVVIHGLNAIWKLFLLVSPNPLVLRSLGFVAVVVVCFKVP